MGDKEKGCCTKGYCVEDTKSENEESQSKEECC